MSFNASPLPISVQNVAELIRTRTKDRGIIQTAGYNTPGDGGGNRYFYRPSGRSLLSSIRGGFQIAGTGLDDYYEACEKTVINARQYGAVGGRLVDATDIFANMAADCMDFSVSEGDGSFRTADIYLPHGDYRVRYWSLPAPTTFYGDGFAGTFLIAAPNAGTCDFTASALTDQFTTKNFPWLVGRRVSFVGDYLPSGIVAGQNYFVVATTLASGYDYSATVSFKVSEVPGGPPIDLTSDGSGLAIHGSFITDRGNAAKISGSGLTCWGNIKSMVDGSQLTEEDSDLQSPYVTSVWDLGPTANKGYIGILWGTGAWCRDVNVHFWRNSIGFDIANNISYMSKVWPEHCGQGLRIRGNGWRGEYVQSTGNRGVSFQYNHSLPFEVDYAASPYQIFCTERVPTISQPVYFLGDDLPAGIVEHQPYFVRTSDLLINFTANASTDTINSSTHGMSNGLRVFFLGQDLPAGLVRGTEYFIVNSTSDTFQVSTTKGGVAVDITDSGSGTMQYIRHSFQVTDFYGGLPIDLLDSGSGDMRYSIYSTAAVDLQGGCNVTDLEIEAPFGYDALVVDGSDQLQINIYGVYWSLNNGGSNFTATASNDTFTRGAAIPNWNALTLVNGLEVYLVGSDLPGGVISNRRYWMRDVSGSTFKLAATAGGDAISISTDGSGTIAFTPKTNNLIRWVQAAGSVNNPRVSAGARGYTNYGVFASSTGDSRVLSSLESVDMSKYRHMGSLVADSLVLPYRNGYAVLTAEDGGIVRAARLQLSNWLADFNGTDTLINLGKRIGLTKSGEYTYSWRCTVRTIGSILAGDTVSTDSYLGLFNSTNEMRHNSYNNSGSRYVKATLPDPCNDGVMHHYVLRRMPGNVFTIWQDGVECTVAMVDDPSSGPLQENTGWINIIGRRGADSPAGWFDGQLDFFRAWDRGLSDTEVADEFAGQTTTALLAYEFTDAAGTAVKDFGVGNNSGTLTAADIPAVWVEDAAIITATTKSENAVNSGDEATDVVIENNRTRIDEIMQVLAANGFIIVPPTYYGIFDGSGDYVTLSAYSPHPVSNSTSYSFAWKSKCETPGRVIAGRTGDSVSYLAWFNGTTSIYHKPNTSPAGYINFTGLADTSLLHTYVLVRNGDGTTFSLWQDGVKFVGALVGTVPNNTCNVNLVGKYGGSLDFDGDIHFFKAWNYALSDAEAEAVSAGVGPTDQVLDLLFDDGSGSIVTDHSASANNGTITGMTWGQV